MSWFKSNQPEMPETPAQPAELELVSDPDDDAAFGWYILKDTKTGQEYIVVESGYGEGGIAITPRLKP